MTDEAQLDAFQADPRWATGGFHLEELPIGPVRDAYAALSAKAPAPNTRLDPEYVSKLRRHATSKDSQIAAAAQRELAELTRAGVDA